MTSRVSDLHPQSISIHTGGVGTVEGCTRLQSPHDFINSPRSPGLNSKSRVRLNAKVRREKREETTHEMRLVSARSAFARSIAAQST
jgi:hypothetical protein